MLIFQLSGGPLALDELVSLVVELWGIKDHSPLTYDGDKDASWQLERLASADVDPATKVEQRMQLARLWEEIRAPAAAATQGALARLERRGRLLPYRLLADIRIASLPQIAEALDDARGTTRGVMEQNTFGRFEYRRSPRHHDGSRSSTNGSPRAVGWRGG